MRSTVTSPPASRPPSISSRPTPRCGSACSAPTPRARSKPVFCAGADLKAINSGEAGGARHQARRLRRLRVPRAHQADHRRGRRSRHRRRLRDRARRRSRRRHHPVGVRPGRGEAQPDRRRRRAVPPARERSARQRRWRRSSPASRSRPSGPTSSVSSTRLVEPGQAFDEAMAPRRADHRRRAAGGVGEPQGRARRRLRGRRDAEADDQRGDSPR